MGVKTLPEKLSIQDGMVTQAQKEHSRAFQAHMPYAMLHHDFSTQKAGKMNTLIMEKTGKQ